MKIDVLVVEDFPLIRDAFVSALEADPDITVVARTGSGEEAVGLALKHRPDVILLDLHLDDLPGLVALGRIRAQLPDARVVILTACQKGDVFLGAMAAGAAGYLGKRIDACELRNAVITVHGGGSVIAPELATKLLRSYAHGRGERGAEPAALLADREQEVLRLVAMGRTDREIGAQLYISPRTVQNHLTTIRTKTGLRRRSELARWAADHVLA